MEQRRNARARETGDPRKKTRQRAAASPPGTTWNAPCGLPLLPHTPKPPVFLLHYDSSHYDYTLQPPAQHCFINTVQLLRCCKVNSVQSVQGNTGPWFGKGDWEIGLNRRITASFSWDHRPLCRSPLSLVEKVSWRTDNNDFEKTKIHATVCLGAAVAKRLACSPPTKADRVQSPTGPLPGFRKWASCRTKPLVGGFSRGSPVFPTLSFPRYSILASIALIGSKDFAVIQGHKHMVKVTEIQYDDRVPACMAAASRQRTAVSSGTWILSHES
ncbi:hypothetical protein PR048_020945 [Dryococelus australis]|uniref:Uncharacterized protein n=1 Tax=Dryococelus australis TaxID=614101 RepID=A0ABQ9GWV0_9NEOP|nr:hypothetical protein PR048_020945 [Dryococelus australis]